MMKRDIQTRSDIETLISRFYEKVKEDPVIGYIFTDVARVNWEKHLPVMFDFWENTLFYSGAYSGNPMKAHQRLHRMFTLKAEHFASWIKLFNSTVDELFAGEKALLAKQRAVSIATIIQLDLFKR